MLRATAGKGGRSARVCLTASLTQALEAGPLEERTGYNAVAALGPELYDNQFLSTLIHEVVASIRLNLKVDWTKPHRDDVKAAVASSVKRVLRRRGVSKEDIERFMDAFMSQAEALYANWPLAA